MFDGQLKLHESVTIERMQKILLEKGIRLSSDDPVFSLLIANDLLLSDRSHKLFALGKQSAEKELKELKENHFEHENNWLSILLKLSLAAISILLIFALFFSNEKSKIMWCIGGLMAGILMGFSSSKSLDSILTKFTNK